MLGDALPERLTLTLTVPRGAVPDLTRRDRDVLDLVGMGKTLTELERVGKLAQKTLRPAVASLLVSDLIAAERYDEATDDAATTTGGFLTPAFHDEMLEGLGISDSGVLIVIAEADLVLEASARNLKRVNVLRAAGLNVYDVLRRPRLLVTKAAVAAIEERLGGASGSKRASK